tara:strand:- start:5620 stop:6246 length:627 start_codon:yes stop_codon:yes gene_type:complete
MSCKGIGKAFGDIADTIDNASKALSEGIDEFADGLANDIGVALNKIKFIKDFKELEEKFKEEFGDLQGLIESLKEGIPFADELGDLLALAAQVERFAAKAKELEDKYGDKNNTINEILRDPAGFFDSLGTDLESLCEAMPNFEKAKDGKIKVTSAKFSQDAGQVDLEEIKNEGFSPTIKRLKDFLKNLRLEVVPKESTVDKDLKAFGS